MEWLGPIQRRLDALGLSRRSSGAIYDKKRSEGPQKGVRVSADENEDERRVNDTGTVYVQA